MLTFFLLTVLCFQHGTPARSARVAFLSGRKQLPAERTLAWRFTGCLPLLSFVLSSVTSHRCAATWNVHRESLRVVCRQVCDTALVAEVDRKKITHFHGARPSQKRRRSCLRFAMPTEQTHQRWGFAGNLVKICSNHCHECQQDIKRLTRHSELSMMK